MVYVGLPFCGPDGVKVNCSCWTLPPVPELPKLPDCVKVRQIFGTDIVGVGVCVGVLVGVIVGVGPTTEQVVVAE